MKVKTVITEPKRVTFEGLNDDESEDVGKYRYDETAPLTPNPNEILKRGSLLTPAVHNKDLYVELPSKKQVKGSDDDHRESRRRASSFLLDPHLEMEETDPLKTYIRQNVSNFKKSIDSQKNSALDESLSGLRERFKNSIQNNRSEFVTDDSPSKPKNVISVFAVSEGNIDPQRKAAERYGNPDTNVDHTVSDHLLPSPQRKHYKMCIKPTFKKTENEDVIRTKLGNNNLEIKIRGNISFEINE